MVRDFLSALCRFEIENWYFTESCIYRIKGLWGSFLLPQESSAFKSRTILRLLLNIQESRFVRPPKSRCNSNSAVSILYMYFLVRHLEVRSLFHLLTSYLFHNIFLLLKAAKRKYYYSFHCHIWM